MDIKIKNKSILFLLPVLSGIILFTSFPKKDFFTGLLSWIAFVPLLLSLEGCSKSRAFSMGILTAITAGLLIGSQIWTAITAFYEIPFLKAALILAFFIIFLGGPHICLFSLFSRLFSKCGFLRPFILAGLWTCLEFLYSRISLQARSYILGYTQHDIAFFYPLARFGGIYALSFTVMFFNVLIMQFLVCLRNKKGFFKNCIAPVILFSFIFSIVSLLDLKYRSGDNIKPTRIALLQTNLGHQLRWEASYYQKQINCLLDMTKEAIKENTELIVWPSTAVILQGKNTLTEILRALPEYEDKKIRLAIGARIYMSAIEGMKRFNSIILCNTKGEISEVYLKKILMPYGEYLPFRWLDIFGKKKYFPDEYTVSKEDYTVFNVGGIRFCTPICLEILYPELIRKFVREGANTILNFSNDNSYIYPAFPYHFLITAKMRGIEFDLPVIRETVNGYSAICNSNVKMS